MNSQQELQPSTMIFRGSNVCFKADVKNSNVAYRIANFLHIMRGNNDLKSLSRYSDHIIESSDNLTNLRGAYGPRLRNWIGAHQLQEMINLNGDVDKAQDFVKPAGIDQMMAVFDDLDAGMDNSTMVVRDPGVDYDETDDVPDLTSATFSLRDTENGETLVCYLNYQEGCGVNFNNEVWAFALLTQIYHKMLDRESDEIATVAIICGRLDKDDFNACRHWNAQYDPGTLDFANTTTVNSDFWKDLDKLFNLAEHIRFYLNASTFSNPDVSNDTCEESLEKVFTSQITDPVLQDMAKTLAIWAFWTYGSAAETYAGDYEGTIVRLLESMNNTFIRKEVKMFLLSQDISYTLKLVCE